MARHGTSTGGCPIHNVIMNERKGVQKFNRCRNGEHCVIGLYLCCAMSPPHKGRTNPLTTSRDNRISDVG